MKGELYTVKSTAPQQYEVTKCDSDFNFTGKYTIFRSARGLSCNCMAYQRPTCRHREMIEIFRQSHALNTGRLYSYDTKSWKDFALEETP